MLRFIVKRTISDALQPCPAKWSCLETVDCDVPELQRLLNAGGIGPSGYELVELVGVEILKIPESSSP